VSAAPRAALSCITDFGLVPYVSYATSFLPTLGANQDGSPFSPEEGRQYEAGVKYQPQDLNALFTLALFDLERDTFVQRDLALQRQVQRGKVTSRYEFEVVGKLAAGPGVRHGRIPPVASPRRQGSARLDRGQSRGDRDRLRPVQPGPRLPGLAPGRPRPDRARGILTWLARSTSVRRISRATQRTESSYSRRVGWKRSHT
jgi:outer membrane receptor protein involved in Fe transport